MSKRLWAVAQMTGTSRVEENLEVAARLIEKAARAGCELVALPENTSFMGPESQKPALAESLDGPTLSFLREQARSQGLFVLVGSLVEASVDPARPYNTSALLGPHGELLAAYRKMHLFDVDVADGRSYRESKWVTPGLPEPVTGLVNGARVGLTVCFDLRFGWLYRALAEIGAEAVFAPAAFTEVTGRDHWEVLVRARAIESQAFVLAPGQQGKHDTGRVTWGRSMIVDPWGTVLATVPDGGSLAMAELDFGRVAELRSRFPLVSRQP